jgi:glycosyltransferase involved in cell wall biosynthesis
MRSVTIAIPTFNRPDLLKIALASASQQDYPDLKIVVSDNTSPDQRVRDVVEAARSADPRITYHRQPTNIGAAANFLFLLDIAETNLFMWLSDDDEIVGPGYVTALVNRFDEDGSARMVFPDVDVFFDADRQSGMCALLATHFASCRTDRDYLIAWCIFGGGHPTYGLYQLDFLRSLEPQRYVQRTLVYFNEGIFLHRAFIKGGLRFCPEATLIYNGNNSSNKETSRRMLASFLRYSVNVHWLYFTSAFAMPIKLSMMKLVAKSHYPYIATLLGKAIRNEKGG